MFYRENLIKHYTPPTCTLEIYDKSFALGKSKYQKIPQNFYFKLHFDDPRLPDEKRITIEGDRIRLEFLYKVVKKYVDDLIKENAVNFPLNKLNDVNKSKQSSIYILNNGLLNQELYVKNNSDTEEKEIVITLTSSQLFDLSDALEDCQIDLHISEREPIKIFDQFSLFPILLATLFLGGSITAIIGRDRLWKTANKEETSSTISAKNLLPTEDLIPPQSLNPSTIPSIPSPVIPEQLKNRPPLPPPSPISQPPKLQENNQNPSSNKNVVSVVPPPPKPPLEGSEGNQSLSSGSDNLIVIEPQQSSSPNQKNSPNPNLNQNRKSSPPVEFVAPPPPPLIETPSSPFTSISPSQPVEKVRLNKLPILTAKNDNSQGNLSDNVSSNSLTIVPKELENQSSLNNSLARNSTTLKPNFLTTETNSVQSEVKQYFQQKWRPPENLNRSLEYRLVINQSGSLAGITPLSQASKLYVDRTGIPLLGESIASVPPTEKNVTIRLILRPDGAVQTFQE